MKTTEYLPTIQRHIEVFRSTEKLAFDRLLRFYPAENAAGYGVHMERLHG